MDPTQAAAAALESTYCPRGLHLDLANMTLNEVELIARALTSGACPSGLKLGLKFYLSQAGNEGIELITSALESGCCPTNLSLCLAISTIS